MISTYLNNLGNEELQSMVGNISTFVLRSRRGEIAQIPVEAWIQLKRWMIHSNSLWFGLCYCFQKRGLQLLSVIGPALLCCAAVSCRPNAYCKRLYRSSLCFGSGSLALFPSDSNCMQDHNQQTGRPAGQLQDTTVFSILCIVILLFLNSIGIFEWDVCWSTSHKTRT